MDSSDSSLSALFFHDVEESAPAAPAGAPGADRKNAGTTSGAMERLLRLVRVLVAAGGDGVRAARLVDLGQYGAATAQDRATQLSQDIDRLRSRGWEIVNTAAAGTEGHYVLEPSYDRLAIDLSPAELAALSRAVQESESVLAPAPDGLDAVRRALIDRSALLVTYQGRRKRIDPLGYRSYATDWQVLGRLGGESVRWMSVKELEPIDLVGPGTSPEPSRGSARGGYEPHSWPVDQRLDAVIEIDHDHVAHVKDSIGVVHDLGDGTWGRRMVVPVVHRAAFLAWVFALGPRVHVLGPDDLRAELLAALASANEAGGR